jgi:hypothetical protein
MVDEVVEIGEEVDMEKFEEGEWMNEEGKTKKDRLTTSLVIEVLLR